MPLSAKRNFGRPHLIDTTINKFRSRDARVVIDQKVGSSQDNNGAILHKQDIFSIISSPSVRGVEPGTYCICSVRSCLAVAKSRDESKSTSQFRDSPNARRQGELQRPAGLAKQYAFTELRRR